MAETGAPTRGCAQCGACCTRIYLPVDPDAYQSAPGTGAAVDLAFIREHWKRGALDDDGSQLWECDRYDRTSRQCAAHDERPLICQNYPWYGDEPTPARAAWMPQQCSYLGDLPPSDRPDGAWPLIPIEVVRR